MKHLFSTLLLTLCLWLPGSAQATHKLRVLFIGNSYTKDYNLPLLTAQVAASAGDTVTYGASAIGGYTLEQHFNTASTLDLIRQGNWDRVVLQEHSRVPSWGMPQVQTQFFKYGHLLDSTIKVHNPHARTFLYMTWGRRDGDTPYCPDMPWVCTYWDMDSTLRRRYEMLADMEGAGLAPVGSVRRRLRRTFPSLDLYIADGSHPTPVASYVAACTMYTTLFGKGLEAVTFTAGHPAAVVDSIHKAVTIVAYDSLAYWRVFGPTPPPIESGWPITFGSSQEDYVRGVVQDAGGNTYVSLSFRGTINFLGTTISSITGTKRDMALAKVNDAGVLVWIKMVGNGSFDMEPQGVNIDGQGTPVWAGSFAGTVNFPNAGAGITVAAAGSYDAFTARIDKNTGNFRWVKKVGGAGNDYLYGCFVSNSGNVYAGGSYTGAINFPTTGAGFIPLTNAGGLDAFIVKFDSSGNGLWASRAGSTGNDEIKSIEYNGGDLVACGYMSTGCTFPTGTNAAPTSVTLTGISGSRDGFAGRINSTGQYVWVKNFGTIFNDEAQSICYDPSTGNVFTAAQVADAPVTFKGTAHGPMGGNDIMVVGWNFYTQAEVWGRRSGSGAGDAPSSLRWDGNRLVLAGFAGGSINTGSGGIGSIGGYGLQDALILRYDKLTGNVTSGQLFGGAGNDRALALWCNTANREEFVGGVFSGSATLPVSAPRVSAGMFDGFIARVSPPVGARQGVDEEIVASPSTGKLNVYPVPAGKELRMMLSDASGLQAFDSKGTRLDIPMRMEGQETVLDVSGLKPGLYVLCADGKTARIVKE